MHLDSLAESLLRGRYWILVPLSLVEGPTVAFVTGVLASRGYFNPLWAYWIFVAKDMVVDGAYYYAGRYSSRRRFFTRLLERLHLSDDDVLRARQAWHLHGWRTMTVGKLSWGLSPAFLASAGIVSVPLPAFLRYAAGVALAQYAALIALGYYFGAATVLVSGAVRLTQIVAVCVAVAGIIYLRRRMRS
jgi:membrane protein DedA with SNARE-associated domain